MTLHFLSRRRLLLLLLICSASSRSRAENYLDYYKRVATAEQEAVNGHYWEALQKYSLAFQQYTYNNPIDCYVAAQLASYTGDTLACTTFLRSGLSLGLPIETIQANPHLAPRVNGIGSTLNRWQIDSCWQVYQQRINHQARQKAIALIRRDESVVLPFNGNGGIYEPDGCTLKARYRPLWDSLLHEIIALTRQSGFPAQKAIGTMNGEDSLFKIGPNSVFIYYILLHHGHAWPQMDTMLWEELQKGNITPQMYGALEDNSNGNRSSSGHKRYYSLRPCGDKDCKKYVSSHLDEINADREHIGLCKYEVMEQKFTLTKAYLKWARKKTPAQKPVFDFKPELHFMGTAQN
jgi:hypothetical protein